MPERSLLFIHRIDYFLHTDAILGKNNQETPQDILDTVITSLIALHDLQGTSAQCIKNSRANSTYIVKPEQHGSEEVAFISCLFSCIGNPLELPRNTPKNGNYR